METKELRNALDIVKPALSTINVIPIFSHLCFDSKTVTAYDDIIGIQVDLETDINGAVHGPTLMGLLSNTQAKEVDVTSKKESIKVKLGRTVANLALLAEDDFVFELPDTNSMQTLDLTDDVIGAITHCFWATGTDQARPVMMGVALKVSGGRGGFYATNSEVIGKAALHKKRTEGMQDCDIILPNEFCANLIKICSSLDKDAPKELMFNKTEVLCKLGNDVRLFGKLINTDNSLDYESTIKAALQQISDKKDPYVPIPKNFEDALKRALIILGVYQNADITAIVQKGKLLLKSVGNENQLRDSLAIDKTHEETTSRMYPSNLLKVIGGMDEIVFGEPCIAIRRGKSHLYLCSNKV